MKIIVICVIVLCVTLLFGCVRVYHIDVYLKIENALIGSEYKLSYYMFPDEGGGFHVENLKLHKEGDLFSFHSRLIYNPKAQFVLYEDDIVVGIFNSKNGLNKNEILIINYLTNDTLVAKKKFKKYLVDTTVIKLVRDDEFYLDLNLSKINLDITFNKASKKVIFMLDTLPIGGKMLLRLNKHEGQPDERYLENVSGEMSVDSTIKSISASLISKYGWHIPVSVNNQ
jgi:hypothetical protein